MNNLKEEVFEMYDKIKLGNNEKCNLCKKIAESNLAGPISIFHVGLNFKNDKYKIVFVGKNTWYSKEDFEDEKIKGKFYADATETGKKSINGEGIKSAYWNYMRAIIEKLYNPNIDFENIAITNIIKCNTTGEYGNSKDETPEGIIKNCIDFKIFEKEIMVLKPIHIIFFIGKDYDDYLNKINFGKKIIEKEDKTIDNGKIVWREMESLEEEKIKVLRISHPQGKHKEIFVNAVVNWIKKS